MIGGFVAEQYLALFQCLKQILYLIGSHYTSKAVDQTVLSSRYATMSLSATINALGRGHHSKQQHSNLEHTMCVLIAFYQVFAFFIVMDVLSSLGILIAKIAFAGEEVIP